MIAPISSVSSLEVGVEILYEETKESLGLPYMKGEMHPLYISLDSFDSVALSWYWFSKTRSFWTVCRAPDSDPSWAPIVINPLVNFCKTTGPGISMGVGI